MSAAELTAKPVAPVEFIGTQSGCGVMPDFDLFNVAAPFCGHKVGATLTADTIHALGYVTPKEAIAAEVQQVRQRMKQTFDPWTNQ
jgi:hypothetical protein